MAKRSSLPVTQALEDLAVAKHPPVDALRALSDLTSKQIEEFKKGWPDLPTEKRLEVMQTLGEMSEETIELDINAVSRAVLADPDDAVRAAAIHNLWEDQGEDLVDPFLEYLTDDASEAVRIAAATALGVYVYLGEMEDLPEETMHKIEEKLLNVFNSEDSLEVRRRALESLGFSSIPEVSVAIEDAHESEEDMLKVSSLFAMGRSLDSDRWGDTVVADLTHADPQIRFEATRAAGELQLEEAIVQLGLLLHDSQADVQEMAVWSLGEIGTEDSRRFLQDRLETADEELTALIEDAMANADVAEGLIDFGMLDMSPDADEEDEQARKARLN
jgi:HEAT repeat protein